MLVKYFPFDLQFKFPAGTSRGILTSKRTWIIKISEDSDSPIYGLGEAGPLAGLSIDDREDLEDKIKEVGERLKSYSSEELSLQDLATLLDLKDFPSLVFALETALLDLRNGGNRKIFNTGFSGGMEGIPINGLIWMGDEAFMAEQIEAKIVDGYSCLKMKIGAINFETECKILGSVRKRFPGERLALRVDANGAFAPAEALEKLQILSEYQIHSIEQPIKAGQSAEMKNLCISSPLKIALDEELIGVYSVENKKQLLEFVRPQFIILKPTLLGGFRSCREWIEIADKLNIGWWLTSALESNIGLNAIAQFTSTLETKDFPQGLGTGQLYTNNIESPLVIEAGRLNYKEQLHWDLSGLF